MTHTHFDLNDVSVVAIDGCIESARFSEFEIESDSGNAIQEPQFADGEAQRMISGYNDTSDAAITATAFDTSVSVNSTPPQPLEERIPAERERNNAKIEQEPVREPNLHGCSLALPITWMRSNLNTFIKNMLE